MVSELLGLLVLAASLTLATPAAAQQARVSTRVQQEPDSVVTLRVELERVTNGLRVLVRDLQLANIALKRASTEGERTAWRARQAELSSRMERTFNDADVVRAHLQALCAERPGPDGYLGVSFSGDWEVATSPSATAFTFTTYPTIRAVEPGSPAQKAGLTAGDEIITLGSHDMVSGALDVALLLKPGVQLPVRYRRDGLLRTLKVLVEPRPQGFMSACPWIEVAVAPPALAMTPGLRLTRTPDGFGYVFVDSASVRTAPRRSEGPTPVLPPTAYVPFRMQGALAGSNALVAGAVLVPLSQDLRDGLGLEDGLLVLDVSRGSPALEAGLRAGDIIVRVNGRKVTSIGHLMAALDETRDRDAELQVRRSAKTRTVRLRP